MTNWRKQAITDHQVREMFKIPEVLGDKVRSYTQGEVDALIAQARREALEEAAQVAEKHLNGWRSVGKGVPVFDYIPIDIRALIDKETHHD